MFLCSLQLPVQKRKKQGGQRKRHFKTHNNHLAGVLEDYSDGVPVKKWNPLLHCVMPSEEWCRICKQEVAGDGDPGHTTIQRLFSWLSNVKQTSLFSFLCTPLSDLVLHGVNRNCFVESFLVCLLISDNWRTLEGKKKKKSTETIKETKTTILKGGAETLLAKCKWGWSV